MKKFIWAFLLIPVGAIAQPLHITARGGFSGYQGDLQSKRLTLDQSHFAFGLGLKYDITPYLAIRTEFNYGKVEASDSKNEPKLRERNLSFQSKIVEGNLLAEYSVFSLENRMFTPYVFAGVGLYHFNPYAFDTLGNKIFLKPLSTEGQGLAQYPDRKEYNLTQFAIPFGAGVRLKVAENITLGYELGLRKLFTDYLDDVSTNYVDQFTLAQERGPKAVEMAFRGGELKDSNASYPVDGTKRGGSEFKDWYYFHGITVTVGLRTNGGGFGSKRGNTGCPTRVL
jgi:opacity protein-like surface antigen